MCINIELNMKEKPMDDHDRLIEMHTDIKWIKERLSDHLTKHWKFTATVIALVIGAILAAAL